MDSDGHEIPYGSYKPSNLCRQLLGRRTDEEQKKNNIRSPYGCMERAKEFMRPELKLKYRLKGAVQYLVYGKFAGEKQLIAKAPYKGLAVCVALPSMLVYHRWSKSV